MTRLVGIGAAVAAFVLANLHRGRKTGVRFSVTDAGDAVKGARVSAGGHSGTTNSKGRVTLQLTAAHALRAVATHGGYVAGTERLAAR